MGAKVPNEADEVLDELAARVGESSLKSCGRPWLARRTPCDERRAPGRWSISGAQIRGAHVSDVGVDDSRAVEERSVADRLDRKTCIPTCGQRGDAVGVEVGRYNGLPAGPLQPHVEASGPGEQGYETGRSRGGH